MSTRKNTPFVITLIGALLCLTLFAGQTQGGHILSNLTTKLTCHFYHANLFHWFCNAMTIWIMRPSPKLIACAFPYAVMAMCFTLTPTVGFSSVIYAYIGMNIIRWNVSLIDWGTFIIVNIITIFIPWIAFGVHLAAFLFGISHYIVERQLNHIVSTIADK